MTGLAGLLNLAVRRHRKQLEQRRRAVIRLLGFDVADAADDNDGTNPTEPPAGGAVVLRLERPAGGGRRETR